MKIETERLIIRDLKKTDSKSLRENIKDLEVSKFLSLVPYPYSIKDANWFINKCMEDAKKKPRESYEFGIELKSEKKIVGAFGITDIDYFSGTCTMGYWLGKRYWRQGIMTEVFKAALDFAFNKLKMRRIDIRAFTGNEASNNLIKKMGFTYEGTSKKKTRSRATGELRDEHFYGLLREDYQK